MWAKLEYNISCKAINRKLEDQCAIIKKVKYKKGKETKRSHFFLVSQVRVNCDGQEKKGREEEEEGEAKKGKDFYDF